MDPAFQQTPRPEHEENVLSTGLLLHTFELTARASGVATLSTPTPITHSNDFNAPPGTKFDFLRFDHVAGRLLAQTSAVPTST